MVVAATSRPLTAHMPAAHRGRRRDTGHDRLGLAAIVVGRQLGTRIPRRAVRYVAAAAFAVFGCLLLSDAVT